MDEETSFIHPIQAYLLMVTSAGLSAHVIVIPHLLTVSGRDAWLAAILALFPFFLYLLLILFLLKKLGEKSLRDWLLLKIGKRATFLISLLFSFYLLTKVYFTMKELIHWTLATYLTEVPNWLLSLLFLIAVYLAVSGGLTTITITNGILLPLILLLGFFAATSNLPNKDYSLLFPLLEDGPGSLVGGMLYSLAGYSEIALILLYHHRVRRPLHPAWLFPVGLIFFWFLMGPLTGALAKFGPKEAAILRFPAFEEWSLAGIGTFFTHVDYLVINQWLSGALIHVSLLIHLSFSLFPHPSQKGMKKGRVLFFLLLFLITMISVPDDAFFRWQAAALLFSLGLILSLLLLLFILSWVRHPPAPPSKEKAISPDERSDFP